MSVFNASDLINCLYRGPNLDIVINEDNLMGEKTGPQVCLH